MKNLRFNGEILTAESIEKAEQFFISIAESLIDDVEKGRIKVNNPESYLNFRRRIIEEYKNKTYTPSVTFLQRAYYIQTGKSIPLL